MKTSETSLNLARGAAQLAMIACTGPFEPVTPRVSRQYSCHGRTLVESIGCNLSGIRKCPPADTADTRSVRPLAQRGPDRPRRAGGARQMAQVDYHWPPPFRCALWILSLIHI